MNHYRADVIVAWSGVMERVGHGSGNGWGGVGRARP